MTLQLMIIWVLSFIGFSMVFTCQAQNSGLIKLQLGETMVDTIYANKRCHKTMLQLEKGGRYQLDAEGEWQDANFEPTDANGFEGFTKAMKRGSFLKPMKRENYMKLIARVRHRKTAVGISGVVDVHKKSRLRLMPNDATFFYGNNSGFLVVTIKRLE